MDEAKVVDLFPDVGEKFADPLATLAVLFEIPERLEKFALTLLAEGLFANSDKIEGLSISFDELGLVVERVDVRRPARHEKKDHPFCSRRKTRCLRGEGVSGSPPEHG